MIKIKARIELFKTEEGRKIPFTSGYRPAFTYSGASTKISGRIDLITTEEFSPGMIDTVIITFIKGMIDDKYFKPGEKFFFGEGTIVMGEGRIEEVIENN